ncbi:MAG: hypothetical protein V4633_07465 [Pseudomonadota bacterium]
MKPGLKPVSPLQTAGRSALLATAFLSLLCLPGCGDSGGKTPDPIVPPVIMVAISASISGLPDAAQIALAMGSNAPQNFSANGPVTLAAAWNSQLPYHVHVTSRPMPIVWCNAA